VKALFLTKGDLKEAGSRCRVYQYLPYLQSRGLECTAAPPGTLSDRPIARLLAARRSDLVMIQKRLFSRQAVRWLRRANPRLIYDFDDAIFLDRHLRSDAQQAVRKKRLDAALQASRLVIAGNAYLADYARPLAREVVAIPTPVDTDRLRPAPRPPLDSARHGPARLGRGDPELVEGPPNERVVIGWIGNRDNLEYFEEIAAPLRKLLRDHHDVELRIVCDAPLDLPALRSTLVQWDLNTEAAELQRFDIGIMPLPDNPFTRGKCGFKALEYMAAGAAVVCSPVGVNAEIIADGENGLLAASARGWLEALHALVDRPSLRARLAAAGRRTVEERYSLSVWAPRFEEALREVAQSSSPR